MPVLDVSLFCLFVCLCRVELVLYGLLVLFFLNLALNLTT